jgi:multidrug efflux system membrane fusion protein
MSGNPIFRKLLIIPPIVIAIAIFAYIVSNKTPPPRTPPTELARSVRVIDVQALSVVPRILGYGSVKPEKIWTAAAEVSGRVTYVHPDFKKGAILSAGTEIVRISPADYELSITQAEANIHAIDAQLEELKIEEQNTRESLEIEERTLLVNEKELTRKRALFSRSTVSQSSVDEEQRKTLAQRRKVQDIKNSLRLIPSQRALRREERAVNEAKLAAANLDLERTHIRLPFDARIAEQNVEETQFAQVGQVLGIADSMGVAEVDAQIPISRFRGLLTGTSNAVVSVTPSSFQDMAERLGFKAIVRLRMDDRIVEWKAKFSRLSDTIDPATRTLGMIAAVDDSYERAVPGYRPPLVKGMFVEVELRSRAIENVIVVPRAAIVENRVLIANADNRLEQRTVTLGLEQGDYAVITEGINVGDRVIVSDIAPAVDGMLLKITVDKDLMARLESDASGGGSIK